VVEVGKGCKFVPIFQVVQKKSSVQLMFANNHHCRNLNKKKLQKMNKFDRKCDKRETFM